jgi:mono/diheme cytochrome c family protein
MAVKKQSTSLLVLVLAATSSVNAQEQSAKNIKRVPVKSTSPASGKEMFTNYCVTCHGTDGKGSGPAAASLKTTPPDLTALARNNGGKYPALKVASILRGESTLAAHGSKEMPIWGPLFRSVAGGHESEVQQRISNLSKYVESLQAK